jgi:hypothetical protein
MEKIKIKANAPWRWMERGGRKFLQTMPTWLPFLVTNIHTFPTAKYAHCIMKTHQKSYPILALSHDQSDLHQVSLGLFLI